MNRQEEMANAVRTLKNVGWIRLAAALESAPSDSLATALPNFWTAVMLFPGGGFSRELARRAIERFGRGAGVDPVGSRSGEADPRVRTKGRGFLS